jgi:hypothetical protein
MFLEIAAAEPEFRATALRRLATIVTTQGDIGRARAVLVELARAANPEDRARTLAQLGRLLIAGSADERAEGLRVFEEAIAAAPVDSVVRLQLENELASLRARSSVFPRTEVELDEDPTERTDAEDLEADIRSSDAPPQRVQAQVEMARRQIAAGAFQAAESVLWDALEEGSVEAGQLLVTALERDGERTGDRLKACRRLVELLPGHMGQLQVLRLAATADRNPAYARAIEHLLRAFDPGAGPLPPPPLSGQRDQPGMLAYLTRPSFEANLEPFAVTWEASHALFTKTLAQYGTTGVDHVVPGAASPVASLYDAALRVLGVPRLPLFYHRTAEVLTAGAALTYPASALLTGDAGKEPSVEFSYALGQALASALPIHVLLLGVTEERAHSLWRALLAAFGPEGNAAVVDPEVHTLAEQFWQSMPPRAQRRLKELLSGTARDEDFDVALSAARQSARRVAMFISGDFGFAARRFLMERKLDPAAAESGGLQTLCADHPALADLFRLAASPEYADARWHHVAPAPQRAPLSSGRRRGIG